MKALTARIILIFIFLALLLVGLRVLIAELYSRQASAFLVDWERRGHVPSERAWMIAEAATESAIDWFPSQRAAYYERQGRVYEWRHVAFSPGHPEARASREKALSAYRIATELRPEYPYPWARILYLKVRLLMFDDELGFALKKASELGRWREDVNTLIVRSGVIAWRHLDDSQRDTIKSALARTAVQNPVLAKELLLEGSQFHLATEFCGAIRDIGEWPTEICAGKDA